MDEVRAATDVRMPRLGGDLVRECAERFSLPFVLLTGTAVLSALVVTLPFHIRQISDFDTAETLRWTGWILGITSLLAVATTPAWSYLGSRRPRLFLAATVALSGVALVVLACVRTVEGLLFGRAFLGLLGTSSTFAFLIARRVPRDIDRRVAEMQTAIAAGQLLGPVVGAGIVHQLGMNVSFAAGAALLWLSTLIVPASPASGEPSEPSLPAGGAKPRPWLCAASVLVASMQLWFLAPVLPDVMASLGVASERMVATAGLLSLAGGLAMVAGSLCAPFLTARLGMAAVVVALPAASGVTLALLYHARTVPAFMAARFLQVFLLGPLIPQLTAHVVRRDTSQAIGTVNAGNGTVTWLKGGEKL